MVHSTHVWELERRTEKIQIRLTPSELETWREQAGKRGMKLSKFIRTQVSRSIDELPVKKPLNDEYMEDLEQKFKDVETGLGKLKDLVDEFRDLFPSNRASFFLE
ncbi:MAG: plasmid mobilization protein [Promethearchaeota archaeon]